MIQKIKIYILSIKYLIEAIFYIFLQYFTSPKEGASPIVIVCASDNNYVPLMAAMIKSIELNRRGSQKVLVYIISNGIHPDNKASLSKSYNQQKLKIEYVEINKDEMSALGFDSSFYGLSTHYYRLLIPYLLPEYIKKVIYLDCDLIINRDISELWNAELADKIVLAARDTRCESFFYGIKNYRELGLDPKTMYFNSGVMLIDLDKWKYNDITRKSIDCTLRNKPFIRFWDQYALNIIMIHKWKQLNPNWNLYSDHQPGIPFIIHFAGTKPTSQDYKGGYKKLFNFYLNRTAWRVKEPA